jgi:hypothetical protein
VVSLGSFVRGGNVCAKLLELGIGGGRHLNRGLSASCVEDKGVLYVSVWDRYWICKSDCGECKEYI